jgi:hypothetical protein
MRIKQMNKWSVLLAFMVIMSVFFALGVPASASANGEQPPETLNVDDLWITGDILNILVTDKTTGQSRLIEMNLRNSAGTTDEYITLQAVDGRGNVSGTFQIKNPYYVPGSVPDMWIVGDDPDFDQNATGGIMDSAPFTPDGTGSVVDNATDRDGKEFFTIVTEDESIFFIVIDRQRTGENVYLLNAVTVQELTPLADDGSKTTSTVPDPPTVPGENIPPITQETHDTPDGGNGTIALIIIIVVAAGGAGYYFKIVRPKRQGGTDDDDYDDYDDEPDGVDEDDELSLGEEE